MKNHEFTVEVKLGGRKTKLGLLALKFKASGKRRSENSQSEGAYLM